jgi:hypothetical protein
VIAAEPVPGELPGKIASSRRDFAIHPKLIPGRPRSDIGRVEPNSSSARANPVLVTLLDKVVRGFGTDTAAMGRALREVFEQDQEGFYAAVLPVLRKNDDSRGFRYLAALFVSNGLINRVLCDGALTVAEAVFMARLALQIDPLLDIALAKQAAENPDPSLSERTERVLAVLSAVSDGGRVLPWLSVLLRHPSPRVRSKAALMLGRGTRNARWVEKILHEDDARVRANAVESIWGVESGGGVREVLEAAAADPNNRVAGNALLALYRLGEASTCRAILQMAERETPAHRATAAWLMGEIEDPRFCSLLARLMADGDATVRRRAHLSVKRLREAAGRMQTAPGVALVIGPPQAAGEEWKVSVAYALGAEAARVHPKPTEFVPFEEDRPVFDYQVEILTPPESLAVALLAPAVPSSSLGVWLPGIHGCLEGKRNSDLWAVVKYREAAGGFNEADVLPARYSSNLRMLAASLSTPELDILPDFLRRTAAAQPPAGAADIVPGFWTAVRRAAGFGQGPSRGARHMLVLNLEERDAPDDLDVLVNTIKGQRIRVHSISTAACPVLEELSRRTGGICYTGVGESGAVECLRTAYALLLARYTIRYRSLFPGKRLRLQIRSGDGWLEGASFAA